MTKTYAQLAREIAVLQVSAQKQLALEAKDAIAKINGMIARFNLTSGDLKFSSTSPSAPTSNSKTKQKRNGVKYRDDHGNQWGGRGPRPAWLRNALTAGQPLESFAVGAKATRNQAPAPPPAPVAAAVAPEVKNPAGQESLKRRSTTTRATAKQTAKKTGTVAKRAASSAVGASSPAAGKSRTKDSLQTKRGANRQLAKKASASRGRTGVQPSSRKGAAAKRPSSSAAVALPVPASV